MSSVLKTHPLLKIINSSLVCLPCPSLISAWWNWGVILGFCLMVQLVSGLFLATHYIGDVLYAFDSVSHLCRDVNYGWMARAVHANGASLFFISLYAHVGRGLYYGSFSMHMTWSIGIILLLLVMAAAFMGYVLPWGQMSFWAATVITNLFSAIPYVGQDVVTWMWGGFAVDASTLTRFFAFHFMVPFLILGLMAVHLLFLHQTGSSNPLGLQMNTDKLPFHPYFTVKDAVGVAAVGALLLIAASLSPWISGDPENFIQANPMVTPTHIQPEWYFLFAYAILRSIPNKLGGVIALAAAVLVALVLPAQACPKFRSCTFYPLSSVLFWSLCSVFAVLTWIGACPVEPPYVAIGQLASLIYFSYFILGNSAKLAWDQITN